MIRPALWLKRFVSLESCPTWSEETVSQSLPNPRPPWLLFEQAPKADAAARRSCPRPEYLSPRVDDLWQSLAQKRSLPHHFHSATQQNLTCKTALAAAASSRKQHDRVHSASMHTQRADRAGMPQPQPLHLRVAALVSFRGPSPSAAHNTRERTDCHPERGAGILSADAAACCDRQRPHLAGLAKIL